jgi:hypothetical protein
MLKALATVAVLVGFAGAALAQSGSGTGAGSGSGGLPGNTGRPSDLSTGSGGPTTGGAILPRDQSPAQQTRQGRGAADLHNNSATRGTAGPTVGPTGIVTPGTASGATGTEAPTGGIPRPLGPGTGAQDRGVPDSSVHNPGVSR